MGNLIQNGTTFKTSYKKEGFRKMQSSSGYLGNETPIKMVKLEAMAFWRDLSE